MARADIKWSMPMFFAAVIAAAMISSCNKTTGYYPAAAQVTSTVQFNAGATAYTITAAPGVVSFSTAAINTKKPNYRQYLVNGVNLANTLTFSLSFHIDSAGSGKYVMEGSQLTSGSKTYISLAGKSTDKVMVTKLDMVSKTYYGAFSFYAFNQTAAADSLLVTGTYSIQ